MSSSVIAADEKKLKAEEGKLKKVFSMIKKMFSKELLWLLFIMLISIPIALIISYAMYRYGSEEMLDIFETLAGDQPTFMVVYIMCAVGIYFSRIVANAIKVQLKNIKKE